MDSMFWVCCHAYIFKCVRICSKPVQMCSNLFKTCSNGSNMFKLVQNLFQTYSHVFKCVQTFSKLAQMCWNVFKHFQTRWKTVEMYSNMSKLVQNGFLMMVHVLGFLMSGTLSMWSGAPGWYPTHCRSRNYFSDP